jgi:lipopolysaccharide transport system permease protein
MAEESGEFDLIIEPGRLKKNYWNDIWHFRELFFFLAWKDILIRYKQTVIGVGWSIIRPLLTMIIFTVVFGKLAKLPSQGVPYPILVFAAMLPWQFFSTSFSEASNSLITNSNMLTKIYFPRMIIPVSTVIVNFVDFLISFVILIGMMIWYQFVPAWQILFLPVFIILALFTSVGAGLYVAALNVKYRDFKYIVPFIVQFGVYISPVGFSSNVVPEKWRLLYSINPMVGVIDGFRWSILGGDNHIYLPGFILSTAVIFLLLFFGILYFRKMEKSFADII